MGTVLCLIASLAAGQTALAQTSQQYFISPDEAVQAMRNALAADNVDALLAIFGTEGRGILLSGDEQADRESRKNFYAATEQQLQLDETAENRRELIVGPDEWPFPIPLVKDDAGWRFDTAAGVDELINRRVGRNELEAIAMLQALADAQTEYASLDRDDDQVLEYAQRIVSSPGQHDGLYWADESEDDPSPIGPYLEDASDYMEGKQAGSPWYGYYFRILTRQGANLPGGAYDYVINGNMIAGFALLAFPAQYGDSGIMTFMISHQGEVYQKDLGADTATLVTSLDTYDPDDSWQSVTD
ncbi:MAG: DUF2950 domain-containing protein [Gammaproteobacteria bacterium]